MDIRVSIWCIVSFLLPQCFSKQNEGEFVDFLTRNNLAQGKAEVVFLLDRSGSVGAANFEIEKGFVESLLTHVVVDVNATRVAVISYSSTIDRHIDFLREPKNKCFLSQELQEVTYKDSKATNIEGALDEALKVLKNARPNVNQVVILISDGLSTYGGDPRVPAEKLKQQGAQIFAFGIGRFLRSELNALASSPRHTYGCSEFKEFKQLARRIRGDPHETAWTGGATIPNCDHMCVSPYAGQFNDPGCCDHMAKCSCALLSGVHTCVCGPGYFGLSGLIGNCKACPKGTYKSKLLPSSSCTSCPLYATTAEEASKSIHDCYCKEGYSGSPADESPCTIIRCPPLQKPLNGFMLGDCENVFGSTCYFMCEEGYELTSLQSEERTCSSNGHWIGLQAICQRSRCNEPISPKFGQKICSNKDFVIGTICKFACEEGYDFVGSDKSECLPNKKWSGKLVQCIEKRCPVTTPLKHGTIFNCPTNQKSVYLQTCVFRCNYGFELVGPEFVTCGINGKLVDMHGKHQFPICKDVVTPSIECPKDISKENNPGKHFVSVSWSLPTISDNSGEDLILTSQPNIHSPAVFKLGTHEIMYSVTDKAGLSNSCIFTITIEDREPPKVVKCPSNIEINTTYLEEEVHWEEPEFKDNSLKTPFITKSHSSGDIFDVGSHVVTYIAMDGSKNQAICTFKVIVSQTLCPYYPAPVNGAFTCEDWMYGQFCQAYCQDKYEFTSQPAEWYICNSEAEWQTLPQNMSIPWPDCANRYSPHRIKSMLSGFYYSGDCHDPKVQMAIKTVFIKHFTSQFNTSKYCSWEGACTIEMVNVNCGEIRPEHSRRRRDLWLDAADERLELELEFYFASDEELENPEELFRQLMEMMKNLSWNEDDEPLTFDVQNDMRNAKPQGTVVLTSGEAELVCELGSILKDNKCVFCPPGSFYSNDTKSCLDCDIGEYQENEGQTTCKACPDGYTTEDLRCKNSSDCKQICLPGTFSSTGLETCISCPLGTYQSLSGQRSCDNCLNGTTTSTEGAMKKQECQKKCISGTFSETGLQSCQPCAFGYYQPLDGQTECLECPENLTTASMGRISVKDCITYDPCSKVKCANHGECIRMNHGFSCLCPKGYSGAFCEDDIDECLANPCVNRGICVNLNGSFYCNCTLGFQGSNCEEETNECQSNPCINRGLCIDEIANYKCFCQSGYTGQHCETKIDYCSGNNTCLNGGICEIQDDTPFCNCSDGFTGVDCSVNINDCEAVTCHNSGSCIDGISSFHCLCSPGYTGELCEYNIDECMHHNCHEGSTCRDLIAGYTCLCQPGWSGSRCENKLSSDFILSFPEVATVANMAQVKMQNPLSEATVSMWVQTTDVHRPGTPLSYAAAAQVGTDLDNALTLSDCSGLQVYVNNEPLPTDLEVTDGLWHHLAFTWSSDDSGRWTLYKDGILQSSGHGLQNGNAIPGNGIMVLGQEQDYVGGGFSPLETFMGNISRVNVWNHVLSSSNITQLCDLNDDLPGKVVAWPDFLGSIAGEVAVVNNSRPFLVHADMTPRSFKWIL